MQHRKPSGESLVILSESCEVFGCHDGAHQALQNCGKDTLDWITAHQRHSCILGWAYCKIAVVQPRQCILEVNESRRHTYIMVVERRVYRMSTGLSGREKV